MKPKEASQRLFRSSSIGSRRELNKLDNASSLVCANTAVLEARQGNKCVFYDLGERSKNGRVRVSGRSQPYNS